MKTPTDHCYHDVPLTSLTLNGESVLGILDHQSGTIDNLSPGVHTLAFETVPGCKTTRFFTIDQCDNSESSTIYPEPRFWIDDPCSIEVDFSEEYSTGTTYQWSDGFSQATKRDICPDDSYSVTITDPSLDCPEEKIIIPCGINFGVNDRGGLLSQKTIRRILNHGDASIPDVEVEIFGGEIYGIEHRSSITPTGVISPNTSVSYVRSNELLTINQSFGVGQHWLIVTGVGGCERNFYINVIECIDPSVVRRIAISNTGTFGTDNSPQISVDIIKSSTFPSHNYLSNFTISLVNSIGEIVVSQDVNPRDSDLSDIIFFPDSPGTYHVIVQDQCGSTWTSIEVKVETCLDGRVRLDVQDECNEGLNLARPWFKVVSFTTDIGSEFRVGEIVNVTIKYHSFELGNQSWYGGDQKIEEIRRFPADPTMDEFRISGPPYRYTVSRENQPGTATVTITTDNGCVYEAKQEFGRLATSFPFVARTDNELVEDFLIARSNFIGPFLYGYKSCKGCNDEITYARSNGSNESVCKTKKKEPITRFTYHDFDPMKPCTGGGFLRIDDQAVLNRGGEPYEIPVYPTGSAIKFESGNTCGCILPAESIGWTRPFPSLSIAVYVEFQCTPNGNGFGVPEIDIEDYCDTFGPNCAGSCSSAPNGCGFDIICDETGFTLLRDAHRYDPETGLEIPSCYTVLERRFDETRNDYRYDVVRGYPCFFEPCSFESYDQVLLYPDIPSSQFVTLSLMYNECSSTINCEDFGPDSFTSTDEPVEKSIAKFKPNELDPVRVFPNPILSNNSEVHISSSITIKGYILIDPQGVQIETRDKLNTKAVSIGSIRNLSSGLYFVRVHLEDGSVYIKKVIIK